LLDWQAGRRLSAAGRYSRTSKFGADCAPADLSQSVARAPSHPLQDSLYCQIRFTSPLLTLVKSRKSVPIGPLLPDNRVWELIVGHLETAILTLDRFLALR
jgi:hypothetical protein